MRRYKRDAVFSPSKKYCLHAKKHDFIEVIRWYNGEGFDVTVNSNVGDVGFKLTYGQFDLLKKLVKTLDKDE